MKYKFLLFIIFVFATKFTLATIEPIDTVLFSKNGKFVLIKEGNDLNGCEVEWWSLYNADSVGRQYYVTFTKDSVFFLTYTDPTNQYPVYPCADTWIKIARKISRDDYNSEFNFCLKSYTTIKPMSFKLDTLKIYYVPYDRTEKLNDSTKFYHLKLKFYLAEELLFTDTFSTNTINSDFRNNISHYTVYYSENDEFYFIDGYYTYSLSGISYSHESISYSLQSCSKSTRKIGKIKK